MASLKRKNKNSSDVKEYKPPMYPTFSVYSSDGYRLSLDEKSLGKFFNAKIRLTGFNKRKSTNGRDDIDWSFEIQSINI